MSQDQVDLIGQLTNKAEQYLKLNKIPQYFDCLDELLKVKGEVYSTSSNDFVQTQNKICTLLNYHGILALQRKDFKQSLEYLRKAEFLSNTQELKVITYNNLACFHRKTGKIRIALNYLQAALAIELLLPQSNSLADTYLNLCAVLSQLDKHDEAIQHIYLSIIMIQHELLTKTLGVLNLKQVRKDQASSMAVSSRNTTLMREVESRAETNSQESSRINFHFTLKNLGILQEGFDLQKFQERIAVLVVAYHNLGVEMEYVKKNLEASKIFQSALHLAEQNLPKNHQMLLNLKQIDKEKANNIEQSNVENILKLNLPKVATKQERMRRTKIQTSPVNRGTSHPTPQTQGYTVPGQLILPNRNSQKSRKGPQIRLDKHNLYVPAHSVSPVNNETKHKPSPKSSFDYYSQSIVKTGRPTPLNLREDLRLEQQQLQSIHQRSIHEESYQNLETHNG